jgi:hypothetical protein
MTSVDMIGTTAGAVWQFLRESGPASLSAIEKGVDAPRTVVAMALGWLAREGKLRTQEEGRTVRFEVSD